MFFWQMFNSSFTRSKNIYWISTVLWALVIKDEYDIMI